MRKQLPESNEDYKVCIDCKDEFPATLEYFKMNKQSKSGLQSRCRKCWNVNFHKVGFNWMSRTGDKTLNWEAWLNIKEYFNNECAYCGKTGNLQFDHFIPHCKGGINSIKNSIPACEHCNKSKGGRYFSEWYPRKEYYSKEREDKILKLVNS